MLRKTHEEMGKKRTPAEQNILNGQLIDAIVNHKHQAMKAALQGGANPNALGVTWPDDPEPSTSFPLMSAIEEENLEAVRALIEYGANPDVLDEQKVPGIVIAAEKGHDQIIEALLLKEPRLIDAGGANSLLYRAICCMGSYGVIQNSRGKDAIAEAQRDILWDYHAEQMEPGVSLPKEPVELYYEGNLDLVKLLLQRAPYYVTSKVFEGFSPLEVVQNPRKYIKEFWDCEGVRTIRSLPFDDKYPNRISFLLTLSARGGDPSTRFKAIVHYDFTKLRALLESYAPNPALAANVAYHAERLDTHGQRLDVHAKRLHATEQNVVVLRQNVNVHQVLLEHQTEQKRFADWLAQPGNENLLEFHGYVNRQLENFVGVLKHVSTGSAEGKIKDAQMEFFVSMLGNLGNLLNAAPFIGSSVAGGVFLFKSAAQELARTRRQNIALRCDKFFGHGPQPQQHCANIAQALTNIYAQPLLALADPRTARTVALAKEGKLRKAQKDLLKTPFKSPAEQAAVVAVLHMVDQLSRADEIETLVNQKGVEHVLVACVAQQMPVKKTAKSWLTDALKQAFKDGILTQSGEYLEAHDFFRLSGVYVASTQQSYAHPLCKPNLYGWRLASAETVAQMPDFRPLSVPFTIEPCWYSDTASGGRPTSSSGDYSSGKSHSPDGSPDHKPALTPGYDAVRSVAANKPQVHNPMIARGELGAQVAVKGKPKR